MSKRIVIIGGVAAGASAAAKARRTNKDAEIVMFEQGPYMSFANCGLPYYIGGEIPNRASLFVSDPFTFEVRFNIDLRLETAVAAIDRNKKAVSFTGPEGEPGSLGYDRLIIATGTVPIVPPVGGIDGPHVFFCRSVPDVDAIMERLDKILPRDMEGLRETEGSRFVMRKETGVRSLIIGGGYIGLECAEQLIHRGIHTTVVEAQDQLMGVLDPEVVRPVQDGIERAGGRVILRDAISRIETRGDRSIAFLENGREIKFDLAILATGVRPNVELAQKAGIELGATGAIAVDVYQRTSDPAIYAAGDNCESVHLSTGDNVNIPLAGPANKQGRIAGQNAALDLKEVDKDDATRLRMRGVLGTGIVRVCGVVAAGTGLTEKAARQAGVDVAVSYMIGTNHAGYYPNAAAMGLKLVFSPEDGRLLGAQAVGTEGVDKRIDVLSTAILAGMSVEDLEHLDLCYSPPFGSAKDIVIVAGSIAANALRGISPAISPLVLREELKSNTPPLVIDVRDEREYDTENLEGAVNIPLEDLRERLEEIPKDRPVVVHCSVGYRSYLAQQILQQNGWTNVRNLYGGFAFASEVDWQE
jgi:NADPH-dependent 2,4-dienoyl-CoA reductase/sulfur reductase-like enzyme/rhodanese-related sulfurtransferase